MKLYLPKYILLSLFALLTIIQNVQARKKIFTSTFGNKAVINPLGWTFTGVNFNIGIICPSTGYMGASGGANLSEGCPKAFINTAGSQMPGSQTGTSTATLLVSTLNFSNIRLSFGMRKSASGWINNLSYTLEWSIDGIIFNPVIFNVSAATDWNLAQGSGLTLPSSAENQPTLFLRWTFVRTGIYTNIKIDDFKVKGDSLCIPASVVLNPVMPFPVCVNSGVAVFETTATGSGTLHYQWQCDSVNISDDSIYGGTHSHKLIITNPPYSINGKFYRCIITNCSGGNTASTKEAELAVQTLMTDINKDGKTDNNDFILLIQNFNISCAGCEEDINHDGVVNIEDFLKLLVEYNRSCN